MHSRSSSPKQINNVKIVGLTPNLNPIPEVADSLNYNAKPFPNFLDIILLINTNTLGILPPFSKTDSLYGRVSESILSEGKRPLTVNFLQGLEKSSK